MKRFLKLLTQLYPRNWRERYEAEFNALLEDMEPSASDAVDIFLEATKMQMTRWSFRRIAILSCLAGVLTALVVALAAPPRYASEVTLTATPTAHSPHDFEATLKQDVFNREFLTAVVQKHNLYPQERADKSVDTMTKNIHVYPVADAGHESKFVLRFDGPDPHVAQLVNAELVDHVVTTNLDASLNRQPSAILRVPEMPSLPAHSMGLQWSQVFLAGLLAFVLIGAVLAVVAGLNRSRVVNG